jgi:hypothetical protein
MKKKKFKVVCAPGFLESVDRCFSSKPKYAIPRWFRNMRYEIRHAWQRLTIGYDDEWKWGLYSKLEWIIPQCVRWMQKHTIGHPCNLTSQKWKSILEKIAIGFESAAKIDEKMLYKGKEFKKLNKQYNEGMKLFVKYFRNLWD